MRAAQVSRPNFTLNFKGPVYKTLSKCPPLAPPRRSGRDPGALFSGTNQLRDCKQGPSLRLSYKMTLKRKKRKENTKLKNKAKQNTYPRFLIQ